MAVFHNARRRDEASIGGEKYGLGVGVTEWFKLAQPSGQHRGDLVKRQFGVDAQFAFGFAPGEALGRTLGEAPLEFGQGFGGECEANGKGVAAKASEEIGAGFDRGEQWKAIDRAA